MKAKIWAVMAVLCMAVFASCSSDEPKSDPKGDEPTVGIEEEDPKDEEAPEDVVEPQINISDLINVYWQGRYFFPRQAGKQESQRFLVIFSALTKTSGIGAMYITGYTGEAQNKEDKSYNLEFEIVGDKVICKASQSRPSSDDYASEIVIRYIEGMLYFESRDIAPVVLSTEKEILSDANGIIADENISDYVPIDYRKIYNLWLHENGLNILDFQGGYRNVYQLVAPGSKRCNYFDTGDFGYLCSYNEDGTYNNSYNDDRLHFCGYLTELEWQIKEVTDTKLVVQGVKDDVEDVYYAASRDILPKVDWSGEYRFGPCYGLALEKHAPWGVGGKTR